MDTPPTTPSARPRLRQAVVFGALLVAVAAFVATRAPAGTDVVPWQDDLAAAREHSAQTGRPVLMYFTAAWCPGCRAMSSHVFGDEALAQDLGRRVIPVKIDLTDSNHPNGAVAQRYNVAAIPTLVLTDATGDEFARYTQGAMPDRFASWIAEHTESPAPPDAQPGPAPVALGPAGGTR